MSEAQAAVWEQLGLLLEQRRVELDTRYRNRQLFCDERGIDYRVAYDLETGARSNYRRPTLTAAEVAYALVPGSIARWFAGGKLAPAGPRSTRPPRHFDSPPLQRIWDDQGLDDELAEAFIKVAEDLRRNRDRNGGEAERTA